MFEASFLLRELNDSAAAEVTLRRAIEQFTILARGNQSRGFQEQVANCQALLVTALADQSKIREAHALLQEAEAGYAKMKSRSLFTGYNIACAYSVLSQAQPSEQSRQAFIQKALQYLHQYVEAGAEDLKFVLEDPDMKPMLELAEFQRIILEMRMPKDPFKPAD